MKYSKTHLIITIIGMTIFIGLVIVMIIDFIPLLEKVLESTNSESEATSYLKEYGYKGIPILIIMQAIVIILTFIPGGAVQILAGLCYGLWLGTIICMVGVVLGNFLVFFSIRQFKSLLAPVLNKKNNQNKKKKSTISLETINRAKHPEYLSFFLFLFPLIPNGFLPYIFAQSKIKMSKYLISISLASIPTILICSLLGDRLADRDFTAVLIIVIFIIAFFLVVFIFRKKIIDKVQGLEK